jgi:hypothetical protein
MWPARYSGSGRTSSTTTFPRAKRSWSSEADNCYETRMRQQTQMLRRVRDTLRNLGCDLLDGALALGQQIDYLRPPAAAERLRHRRERIEKRHLCLRVRHKFNLSLKYLNVKC